MQKVLFAACLMCALGAHAQDTQSRNLNKNVHLFINSLTDSPISDSAYAEGALSYLDYDEGKATDIGVDASFPITDRLEVAGNISYLSIDPDGSDSESGITDIGIVVKYNLQQGPTNFTVGGQFTLPTGDEDIGQDNFNFGGFGSVRHAVSSTIVLTGLIGANFLEIQKGNDEDREFSLNLAGGAIFQINTQLSLVAEADLETETDEMLIFGGADYAISGGHLRGGIGFGLDDGSPDFALTGGYLVSF